MDVILNFFTDTLSGYVYIITTIISIIIILGIVGFLSERKFNLENNGILTRTYNSEDEDEIILGDQTLYDKKEEIIAQTNYIPNMNSINNTNIKDTETKLNNQNSNHKDEVI